MPAWTENSTRSQATTRAAASTTCKTRCISAVGSRLHLLHREKDLARVGLLAEQYAREALQPIVDDGRATRLSVSAAQPHDGRVLLHVRIETERGSFDYRHEVPIV